MVCSCYSSVFLAFRVLGSVDHVRFVQRFQTKRLQVQNLNTYIFDYRSNCFQILIGKTIVSRDSMIVTTLDTFTSLISGITIFAILGNLAYELGYDDVEEVIGSGGTSLAFISYPDAIAKSPFAPQVRSFF